MVHSVYEQCALSIFGDPRIISMDGGAGNGKSHFIRRLLDQFIEENFQYTKAILVCGISVASMDRMANSIMKRHHVGVRCKARSDVEQGKMRSAAKIVFTTLDVAVELL